MSTSFPTSLIIKPKCAKLLNDTETFYLMSPFCSITLGSQEFQTTSSQDSGKFPTWDDTLVFSVSSNATLHISVHDKSSSQSKGLLGEASFPIDKALSIEVWEDWIDLELQDRKTGTLKLSIELGTSKTPNSNPVTPPLRTTPEIPRQPLSKKLTSVEARNPAEKTAPYEHPVDLTGPSPPGPYLPTQHFPEAGYPPPTPNYPQASYPQSTPNYSQTSYMPPPPHYPPSAQNYPQATYPTPRQDYPQTSYTQASSDYYSSYTASAISNQASASYPLKGIPPGTNYTGYPQLNDAPLNSYTAGPHNPAQNYLPPQSYNAQNYGPQKYIPPNYTGSNIPPQKAPSAMYPVLAPAAFSPQGSNQRYPTL